MRALNTSLSFPSEQCCDILLHPLESKLHSQSCFCHSLERTLRYIAEYGESNPSQSQSQSLLSYAENHISSCKDEYYSLKALYWIIRCTGEASSCLVSLFQHHADYHQPWCTLSAVELAYACHDSSVLCDIGLCPRCSHFPMEEVIDSLESKDTYLLMYLNRRMDLYLLDLLQKRRSHVDVYEDASDFLQRIDYDPDVIISMFNESVDILHYLLNLCKALLVDSAVPTDHSDVTHLVEFFHTLYPILIQGEKLRLYPFMITPLITRIKWILDAYVTFHVCS